MCQNVVGKEGEIMNGFKKIGEKIKYYREKRGLSQKMLAKRTYMTPSRDRKSTRLNSSHRHTSRMPSSA